MQQYPQLFEQNMYVYLPDFLDKENCQELTNELNRLVKEGHTQKDIQCPASQSVYGAKVFDSLLEQLKPYFEQASGRKLLPTYSYARLYVNGEVLELHKDRPSCEISATITLGFDHTGWPIKVGYEGAATDQAMTDQQGQQQFVKDIKTISMNVGDAVLYKGCDLFHWREPFEGQWQAQVFLHYVDAAGPHSTEKYDGRTQLGFSKHTKQQELIYWYYADALSVDACNKIIQGCEAHKPEQANIGIGTSGSIDLSIRDVKKVNLPSWRGIGATMAGIGLDANNQAWQFNITHADQTDFLRYDSNGHYREHLDTFLVREHDPCRKLTILTFLNDDFEGGKLFLRAGHEKIYPPQKAGTVLVFPSFLLHGVEPVKSGVRRSIVTWLVGPWFR